MLPFTSVTVHVTVVMPIGNVDGALLLTVATPQLSPVVGVPSTTLATVHWPVSVFTTTLAGHVIVGG